MVSELCKFVQPEYVKKFHCIADLCEDTCCSGWTIYVDKNAYDKCKEIKEIETQDKINRSIFINDENSIKNYAFIKFDNKGLCPLLNPKGFCTLHLNYGEEYLGEVCNLYPRNIRKLNNSYIQVLSLSCIEAARLCLLSRNGINFEVVNFEHQDKFDSFVPLNTDNYENQEFINILMYIIGVLQNDSMDFSKRLVILGYFMHDLEQIFIEERYKDIQKLFNKYKNIDKEVVDIGNNLREKIKFIFSIIDKRMNEGISNKVFYKFLQEFQNGFVLETEMDLEDMVVKYEKGFVKLKEKFLNKHLYIWENYFVNTVFKELIPLNVGVKSTRAYFCLLLQYALLECFLVGIINYNENLTTEDIVKFIASFERVFPYNYLDKCYDDLSVELKDNFEFYKALL